jgi:integrase
MLELRKRHLRKCPKHAPGSPFSTDLDCKRCVYYAFGKLNGKKIRQSLDTTDRQEAASRLLKIEAEAKAPFKYTLAEAVKKFLAERENSGHRPKSILRYQYSLERLTTFLAGKGVTQLRAVRVDDLSDWKAAWTGQTDLGKQKEQERLRTFFRWCERRKYIEDNPTEGLTAVKAPKGGKRERFTDEQVAQIFKAIDEVYPDPAQAAKVHSFLLVLRYTALRIGDVTNLQKSHLVGDRLFLHATKNEQPVYTVVPKCVLDALKEIETASEFYFFPGNDGTLETWKKKWSLILQPIYEKSGVKYRSHAWRDTLVYKLLRANVPIEVISRLLGHSDVKMTWDHYSAWVPELQQRLETTVRTVIHEV